MSSWVMCFLPQWHSGEDDYLFGGVLLMFCLVVCWLFLRFGCCFKKKKKVSLVVCFFVFCFFVGFSLFVDVRFGGLLKLFGGLLPMFDSF